ncbi:6862_t:CDS:2, partial [Funneliformis caledonium]
MPQKIFIKERREVVKSLWNNGIQNLKKTKNLKQRCCSGRLKVLSPKKRRHLSQLARSPTRTVQRRVSWAEVHKNKNWENM